MLAQHGGALPRELTGRTRYRAWGYRVEPIVHNVR
jgi:hypothetical protein